MAQYGGQMQGPPIQLCDYCHQKQKLPPYNYCSKTCGSRAKATGSNPPLCKQCGQKQVYKGHQFCGRNCANTWQAIHGQINTGGYGQPQHGNRSRNAMPPPQMQNPPINSTLPFQGFGQGSGGDGGIKGIVKGLKSFVSQGQQPQPPQQYPGAANHPYMQQVSGRISPNPSMISPPVTPMSSGMGTPISPGMDDPMGFDPMSPGMSTPTTSNQQYYDLSPTDPDANGQHFPSPHIPGQGPTPGQQSKTTDMAVDPSTNPTDGDDQTDYDPNFDPHADPNQDPAAASNHRPGGLAPIHAQAQLTARVSSPPIGAGGHGNGYWDPNDPNNFPSHQSTSTSSGSSTTCRLKGCNKPVFVDPTTHHRSEYCSQRHREEATAYGQVNPCIMCRKMPRGPNDHFCSRACRDKALNP